MKYAGFLVCLCLALSGCKDSSVGETLADAQAIEYQIKDNEYAVVVLQKAGMTEEQTKQLALQKAAEKTRDQKYRYFTIESQEKVHAMSGSGGAYDSPPQNMYYELFQSGDYGRDRFDDESSPQENIYPGYRIVFKCYQEKPSYKAIDACEVIPCKRK